MKGLVTEVAALEIAGKVIETLRAKVIINPTPTQMKYLAEEAKEKYLSIEGIKKFRRQDSDELVRAISDGVNFYAWSAWSASHRDMYFPLGIEIKPHIRAYRLNQKALDHFYYDYRNIKGYTYLPYGEEYDLHFK